jgi:hypothetical protein
MQFLRRMRNTTKKFYWHHIYNGRANIQHVSVLRDNQPDSANTSEDDDDIQIGPHPQTQQPPKLQWTLPSCLQQSVVHTYRGRKRKE